MAERRSPLLPALAVLLALLLPGGASRAGPEDAYTVGGIAVDATAESAAAAREKAIPPTV